MSPKTTITLIIFAIALGITALLIWPKYQEVAVFKLRAEEARENLQLKEQYFLSLKDAAQELERYEPELSKIDSAFPSEPSLPSLFKFLQETSSQNGLILKSIGTFSTSVHPEKPGPEETRFDIGVSGSYPSFKNFLLEIEKSGRLIEVESVSIYPPSGGEGGAVPVFPTGEPYFYFTFKIKVYSYPR